MSLWQQHTLRLAFGLDGSGWCCLPLPPPPSTPAAAASSRRRFFEFEGMLSSGWARALLASCWKDGRALLVGARLATFLGKQSSGRGVENLGSSCYCRR